MLASRAVSGAAVAPRLRAARGARPLRARPLVARAGPTSVAATSSKGAHSSGSASVGVPSGASPVPAPAAVGAGAVLLAALARAVVGGSRRGRGSLAALEERGALDGDRDAVGDDFDATMRGVRVVTVPTLSDEQIAAARERRRRARVDEDGDPRAELAASDLPKNHPFATSAKAESAEEEAERVAKVRELNRPRRRRGRGGAKGTTRG